MEMVFWIVILVIMAVVEFASVQLVAIWFALASLVAFFVALGGAEFWVQCTVFVGITAILLMLTRPLTHRLFRRRATPTNADRNIGATAIVVETIDNEAGSGRVRLDGLDWMARSEDGTVIFKNSTVIVDRIEGAKLIVIMQDTPEQA